jgi:hypothetical protein
VLGVKLRAADEVFFGDTVNAILESTRCPLLLVKS